MNSVIKYVDKHEYVLYAMINNVPKAFELCTSIRKIDKK